ncbi:MAG: hypothetical protein E7529_02245 [Ruminococcaceae bacterium]|nr:hypothetical protein [Oscillospiraceae bacterium]
MKIGKRILSIMLVIVTLVSVVSVSAEALKVVVTDEWNYGYMVPMNNNGSKVLSTVKLYGNYDYLNLYIHSGYAGDVYFFYEIYSDKNLTNLVDSGYTVCYYGNYNISQKIKLKDKYKSKTYYGVTYAGMFSSNKKKLTVDEDSLCSFKIVVDRSPSYDEKMVALKSVSNTIDGPEITWTKISGTSKYYIYRRNINSTKWKRVGTVSGKKSSFLDTSIKKKDGSYIYTVKGKGKNGDISRYHYSGLTCLYAETPKISTAYIAENNEIYVKWNETSSKAKYYIYRKVNDGSWERVDDDYDNYYIDKNIDNANTYSYRVKAIIDCGDYGKAKSCYSSVISNIKFLSAPVMNELEIKEGSIGVSWRSVEGAVGYSVLRKPLDSDEDWTVLAVASGEETAFEDATAAMDGAYLYTVRSEGDGFSGSYSSGKEYLTLKEPEFTVDTDGNRVHIKWDKVPYATSYRVLEQAKDGSWQLKTKTKKLYYEFTPSGYYNKKLTVYACRTGDIFSSYKTDVESVAFFPQITHKVKELDTYTQFSWNSTGADEYRVYRKPKDAEDSAYELFYVTKTTSFDSYNPEEDVAYTYQIRGVYGDLEQDKNLYTKTHIRYAPETCIEGFKAYKEVKVFNSQYKGSDKETTTYRFEVEKTDKFKKSDVKFYYWGRAYGGDGWGQAAGYYYTPNYEDSYDLINPARFCCVVSTSSGNSTPLGANIVYVEDETCKAPVVTLTPTSKGLKMTWDAVDDAVEYDVHVYFSKRDDYHKTVKSDGSKTYAINFTDLTYDNNIYLTVTAVHKNGNKTMRYIDDYALYPRPKLVAAVPDNFSEGIDFFWNTVYDDGYFAVLRKAEGETKWTCISKKYYDGKVCSMNNGVEYRGFCYTDKNIKKGVKYTYTVRWYDTKTKEYTSYYNTKGVSAKR